MRGSIPRRRSRSDFGRQRVAVGASSMNTIEPVPPVSRLPSTYTASGRSSESMAITPLGRLVPGRRGVPASATSGRRRSGGRREVVDPDHGRRRSAIGSPRRAIVRIGGRRRRGVGPGVGSGAASIRSRRSSRRRRLERVTRRPVRAGSTDGSTAGFDAGLGAAEWVLLDDLELVRFVVGSDGRRRWRHRRIGSVGRARRRTRGELVERGPVGRAIVATGGRFGTHRS